MTFNKNLTTINFAAFYHCEALKSVIIPDKLTVIENRIFSQCTSLLSIIFNENLTAIGLEAFAKTRGERAKPRTASAVTPL